MTHEQMIGAIRSFSKESFSLNMDNVEDFRVRFKKFLVENDMSNDILIELRQSMIAERFFKCFGTDITDIDARIKSDI